MAAVSRKACMYTPTANSALSPHSTVSGLARSARSSKPPTLWNRLSIHALEGPSITEGSMTPRAELSSRQATLSHRNT